MCYCVCDHDVYETPLSCHDLSLGLSLSVCLFHSALSLSLYSQDRAKLYYHDEDRGVDLMTHVESLRAAAQKKEATAAGAAAPQEQDTAAAAQSSQQPAAVVAAAPVPAPQLQLQQAQASGGAPPEDKPLLALDTLKTLLALKLKRGVEEVRSASPLPSWLARRLCVCVRENSV